MTTASTAGYPAFREYRFLHAICWAMAAIIALAAWRPDTVFDFLLENGCVLFFLLALMVTYRKMPFSGLSYLLILVYLSIHEWGAHYKYSDVPLGEWMKPWLHTKRNMYDRVAHFSFGLLLSYPMQEVLMRSVGVANRWRYVLPVEATLSFSAIYEILEALMAMVLTPERGEEFVGMQGDMWDSQEDMLMAGLGSVVAMIAIAAIRRALEPRRAARAVEKELALYRANHG
ncbi:MAG TPA: DUF2238 domain-containing protein [Bryobacteraceae bacterium]|nr:DUF2238 domain-containing protein [Bryobacteraceae bacterium]